MDGTSGGYGWWDVRSDDGEIKGSPVPMSESTSSETVLVAVSSTERTMAGRYLSPWTQIVELSVNPSHLAASYLEGHMQTKSSTAVVLDAIDVYITPMLPVPKKRTFWSIIF